MAGPAGGAVAGSGEGRWERATARSVRQGKGNGNGWVWAWSRSTHSSSFPRDIVASLGAYNASFSVLFKIFKISCCVFPFCTSFPLWFITSDLTNSAA